MLGCFFKYLTQAKETLLPSLYLKDFYDLKYWGLKMRRLEKNSFGKPIINLTLEPGSTKLVQVFIPSLFGVQNGKHLI